MSNSKLADEQKRFVPSSLPPAVYQSPKAERHQVAGSDNGTLTDEDLDRVKAIVSEEIRQAAPHSTNFWPVALSIIGATVAVIGTLGPLMIYAIGKDHETRIAMLESIKESVAGVEDSVAKNTSAIITLSNGMNRLEVAFTKLDGNVEDLNDNFGDLINEIDSRPRRN